VAHEGDITDKWNATEYDRSLTAMTKLEDPVTTGLADGIPYAMLMGNHDDDNPALFNQYYGVSRFSGRSYYGGHYGTANDHNYMLVSGAGLNFVVVSLSYAPSSAVLTWAKGVLDAYPNRVGIVVSHSILNESATVPAAWTSEGANIYNALRGTANLRLMLCGHMSTSSSSPSWHGEGRRTDTYGGYTIHSLLADYQDRGDGGGGRLRILQFVPAANQVRVRTYSPYTDVWEADADSSSQFTLDVDLGVGSQAAEVATAKGSAEAGAPAEFTLLGTVTGVPSGATASLDWDGLDPLTRHEWYVKVSDGRTTPATGPIWGFTTGVPSTSVEGPARGALALAVPVPNPARGALRFSFDLPRAMRVRLDVLDVRGRVVAVLAEGDFGAGSHSRVWDSSASGSRASGLYFVRLETPEGRLVRRATVLR